MSIRAQDALYLGFDVGTQGTKGLLVDAHRKASIAQASRSYGLIEGLPPGAAEQHPDVWIAAVRDVARELARAPHVDVRRLAGIGVSGQQHGLVALDERGEVVRPAKLWCDTSTAREARALSDSLGRRVPAGFTASKVLWLAQREPHSFERTRFVLLPHDYVNLRLTGQRTMEAGDASGTGFFDPVRRAFDERAMAAIDARLSAMVPPLVAAGEPAGRLTAEGADLLGFPAQCVGVPIASGGGDNMLSAIGAGATRAGVAVLSLGTSATVFCYSAKPVIDPAGLIAPFCDSTGGWLPLLCTMNATGVLEETRAAFGDDVAALTRAAESVAIGCDGLTFLPFLNGERVPDLPEATGTLTGLRPGLFRAGHVFRAALEGVALNLAWGVERMRALGLAIDTLHLAGGGARNALWRTILADALEAPVSVLAQPESAALGAALQALWTARRLQGDDVSADDVASPFIAIEGQPITPDPARSARYRELSARFRELCVRVEGAETTG